MVLVAGLLFAGCSADREPGVFDRPPSWSPSQNGWPYPTPVDWTKYRPGYQQEIDSAGTGKDCAKLDQLMIEALESEIAGSEEILTYVSRWGKHLECEQFRDPLEQTPIPEHE